jgi:hypothetical protein
MPPFFMVFDVESVGLHGEGFAVGWCVIDRMGNEIARCRVSCDPDQADGSDGARKWVAVNIPPRVHSGLRVPLPEDVREAFWDAWLAWKAKGAVLVADCAWPVEARFLAQCVDDRPHHREWEGPYPLYELASFRLAAGFDPLGTFDRLPDELPAHDPLADARQSARLLVEALRILSLTEV